VTSTSWLPLARVQEADVSLPEDASGFLNRVPLLAKLYTAKSLYCSNACRQRSYRVVRSG
jgi:hypothetical protein